MPDFYVSLGMRSALPVLLLAALVTVTPAAASCYSWQIMTCGQPKTQTVLDEHRTVRGYLEPQSNGTVHILGKDREIRGYIEDDRILGKDRRVRGYVEQSDSLVIEGLPRRYSPALD